MILEKIKKLILSSSTIDNKIGLLLLGDYIKEHGIENLSPVDVRDTDGEYCYLNEVKTCNYTEEDRKRTKNYRKDIQGVKYRDFSLNMGGWHIVYASKGSKFYDEILWSVNNVEDLTNE